MAQAPDDAVPCAIRAHLGEAQSACRHYLQPRKSSMSFLRNGDTGYALSVAGRLPSEMRCLDKGLFGIAVLTVP